MVPIALFFIIFLSTRLAPYLWNGVPLGYDPGIYLYIFKKYSELPFSSLANLPEWVVRGTQPGIPIIARILTIFSSPEEILVPLVVISQLFLFVSVFLLAKTFWDSKTALWTVFLFTCSALQFRLYWYFYLNNITALAFLMFAIRFLYSGSYFAIPFIILVLYFHQLTGAFLVAVIFLLLVLQKGSRRYLLIVITVTLSVVAPYYLSTFNQTLAPYLRTVMTSLLPSYLGGNLGVPSGTFHSFPIAILLALPYLGFSICGLRTLKSRKEAPFIIIPITISFGIVLFGIALSRRFIPLLDLFLIFPAGYSARWFFKRNKSIALIYLLLLVTVISVYISKTSEPLILEDELKEISQLSQTEPNSYVLVTDQEYTPWVYGWSDRKPIAPGFGEYDIYWSTSQWYQFWQNDSPETLRSLLLKLPKPLYLYHGDHHWKMNFSPEGECFERINWRTWKFVCEK